MMLMNLIHIPNPVIAIFIGVFIMNFLRYVLVSGGAFLLFWKLLKSMIYHRRIQNREPEKKDFIREILYSLSTMIIFSFVGIGIYFLNQMGYAKIYKDINEYGIAYFIFSIIFLFFLHDTYFYWTHRLIHHPVLFKYVHLVHHKSNNPSPFAAFSFHPLEAIIQSGILSLAILLLPLHTLAIFIFLTFSFIMNVLGHIGFEFYFKGFTKHTFFWWNNTSTHHNMHHRFVNWNFGLYFNIWDRLMKTNHPQYFEFYDKITEKPLILKQKINQND